MMAAKWISLAALLVIAGSTFAAGVPALIAYQGKLTTAAGQPVTDGVYQINFRIYGSAAGADMLWSSGAQPVQVTGGSFSYQLGSSSPFPSGLFADSVRYLGITVGTDAETTPRTRLVSTPYAFHSFVTDTAGITLGVADGAITDADVSASAAIGPLKISGTAATLSGAQTFTGWNKFNELHIYDSVFAANSYGVRIGTAVAPVPEHLFEVKRRFNTASSRQGVSVNLESQSTGTLYGVNSAVLHSDAGGGGSAYGAYGDATTDGSSRTGVYGQSQALTSSLTTGTSFGVRGTAFDGTVAYGVYGYANSATTNYAGYFSGNVHVTGTLTKGSGAFKIDHPLDPENKYLQHSFVESPDMKNIYDGVVVLDAQGEARVLLPEYFEALNTDFRYQLTAIGTPAPNLHVAREVRDNSFAIAGGAPGMRVSWQVTGIRLDAYAEMNRIQVEIDKRPEERGRYLHPEAFKRERATGVDWLIDGDLETTRKVQMQDGQR